MRKTIIRGLLTFSLAAALILPLACGGGSSGGDTGSQMWTWMSGSNTYDQLGVYSPAVASFPGARYGSALWTDNADNLWLFGGYVRLGAFGSSYYFNDLWRFDGTYWTWMSGSDNAFPAGVYGFLGQPDAANVPGPRAGSASWTDSAGNLWLFGGGYHSGRYNDLWRFDGIYWTWMGGSDTIQQPGVYGTLGVPDSDNVPGARERSALWKDSEGNIWLFGGVANLGRLNDLWRFDGVTWTWMSGSSSFDQLGIYGEMGTPDSDNLPGGRSGSVLWMDDDDNLWLFGGSGYSSTTSSMGGLNDLWMFDGTNWTWMGGSDLNFSPGVYGTMGSPDPANIPGARYTMVSWMDSSAHLWLFGGYGHDGTGLSGALNDLWKFDGANWTWMGGSDTVNSYGVYGTMGSSDATNLPGARMSSASCTDKAGNMWLFGGNGYDEPGNSGSLNDLWVFSPGN